MSERNLRAIYLVGLPLLAGTRPPTATSWCWASRTADCSTRRPGNVHDSKQAVPFLREVIDDLRRQLRRRVGLEFRMDAAFFQLGILPLLTARDCGDAIKVGYWSWLPLKAIAAACRRWAPVAPGVTGTFPPRGWRRPPRHAK